MATRVHENSKLLSEIERQLIADLERYKSLYETQEKQLKDSHEKTNTFQTQKEEILRQFAVEQEARQYISQEFEKSQATNHDLEEKLSQLQEELQSITN